MPRKALSHQHRCPYLEKRAKRLDGTFSFNAKIERKPYSTTGGPCFDNLTAKVRTKRLEHALVQVIDGHECSQAIVRGLICAARIRSVPLTVLFGVSVVGSAPIDKQVFSSTYNWSFLAAGLQVRNASSNLLQAVDHARRTGEDPVDMLYIISGNRATTANDAAKIRTNSTRGAT
jgi:hypothetical protein